MHERRVINHIGPNFQGSTLRVIWVRFCLSVFCLFGCHKHATSVTMHERRVINHIGPNFQGSTLRVIRVRFWLSFFFNLAAINTPPVWQCMKEESLTILDPTFKVPHWESFGLGFVCLSFFYNLAAINTLPV